MAKEMKKKKMAEKPTVISEINNSLNSLAAYLSGFANVLRATAIKQEMQ